MIESRHRISDPTEADSEVIVCRQSLGDVRNTKQTRLGEVEPGLNAAC